MGVTLGKQDGIIIATHIGQNDKGTLFVSLKLGVGSDPTDDTFVYSNIYITEKSFGIARARLKACGFDVDKHDLSELEESPGLLEGRAVKLDIREEEYKGKPKLVVDIVTEREKAPDDRLKWATKGLRDVKKKDASPEVEDIF